jgi:multidrug resistance efflux pump
LAALSAEVSSAKSKAELDSIGYVRVKALRAQNAGTQQQLDNAATLAYTSKENWEKTLGNFYANREKLRNDVKNTNNQLKAAKSQKKDFTVLATINGKVYDIMPKVGELIGPQVSVMEIGSTDAYEVELAIDESDANFVQAGQAIVFSAEFLGNRTLKGVIKQVYPKITLINKSIKAIASVEASDNIKMYAGSTIEANIVYRERKNVLVLPRFYVLNDTVIVRKGLGTEKRKISTGASDVEFVEITAGLTEADQVFRP